MSKNFKYVMKVTSNVNMDLFGPDMKMDDAGLESYRVHLNASFLPGGCNAPRDPSAIIPHVSRLELISVRSGKVIATASAPMFEVA